MLNNYTHSGWEDARALGYTQCFLLTAMQILDYQLQPITVNDGSLNWNLVDMIKSLDLGITVVYDHRGSHHLPDFSLINKSTVDLVLFAWAHHSDSAQTDFRYQQKYFESLHKPYLVLSVTDSDTNVYCPWWLITYPLKYPHIPIPSVDDALNYQRRFTFACINNTPRMERLINLTYMMESDCYADGLTILTMGGFENYESNRQTLIDLIRDNRPGLLSTAHRIVETCPIGHSVVPQVRDFWNDLLSIVDNPAYLDTYVSVITEHGFAWNINKSPPFISEKSIKPMLAGQMFTMVAAPGTLDLLRDQGFDVFDDIIDHRYYSNHQDFYDRLDHLHHLLASIKTLDWPAVFAATTARRRRNYELAVSGEVERKFADRLTQRIKTRLNLP